MNKSRCLIVCADERTWFFDRPVLFLGEWCKRYNRKEIWNNLDFRVARPFSVHSNERDHDYKNVNTLKEKLIPELCNYFNDIHKTDYSQRYWRIIIGHWLHRYIAVIYNRYHTLKQCLNNYNISGIAFFEDYKYSLATPDSNNFIWACNDDIWNNILFKKIYEYLNNKEIQLHSVPLNESIIGYGFDQNNFKSNEGNKQKILSRFIKKNVYNLVHNILIKFSRDNDGFIIGSYLPTKTMLKLQYSLKQIPIIWKSPEIEKIHPNLIYRNILKQKYFNNKTPGLDMCIKELFFELLPTVFLEGYQKLNTIVKELDWPTNPKFIFTSNNFDADELFKIYTANKVEKECNYFIGQHGNNYGTSKYCYSEYECLATCDRFFTWGWKTNNITIPAFNFKTANTKVINDCNYGGLLLIEMCIPQRCEPWDIYPDYQAYQDDQFLFVENIPESIRRKLIIRLQRRIFTPDEWFEEIRWKEKFNNINIDYGYINIKKLIEKSRLVVHSYDSTGILETLSYNIPTICFWRGGLEHLIDDAKQYYRELEKVGILHFTPISAAKKIGEIWNHIEDWWYNQNTQNAIQKFCNKYSRIEQRPVNTLKYLLINNSCK